MLRIRCVNCQGESQVAPESIGQVVACPHCGKPTPAVQHQSTPPPPPPASSAALTEPEVETKPPAEVEPEEIAPPEPHSKKPLTREQQLARRAKLKLLLAIGSAVLLAIVAVVLAKLGQP